MMTYNPTFLPTQNDRLAFLDPPERTRPYLSPNLLSLLLTRPSSFSFSRLYCWKTFRLIKLLSILLYY